MHSKTTFPKHSQCTLSTCTIVVGLVDTITEMAQRSVASLPALLLVPLPDSYSIFLFLSSNK